jgi:flagellar export protein FliJ
VKGGLDLVRRFAEIAERMARRDLAEAALAVRGAEERQEALVREARRQREAIAASLASGTDAPRVGSGYRCVRAAEQQAHLAAEECDELRRELARREAAWTGARRSHRGLAAILARRARKAEQLRDRREQQALDDLVNAWGGGFDAR